MSNPTKFFGEPISVYTMSDAIADGAIVETGNLAKELFSWPVYMTKASYEDAVAWTDADSQNTGAHWQSQTGRLWDVLWMTLAAIKAGGRNAGGSDQLSVQLCRVSREHNPATQGDPTPEEISLKVVITTLDDGSPVLLISLPEED